MKQNILDFITKFKFEYPHQLEYVFTHGNCYYFAMILKERFHGQIYYLPIANHFVCKIDNNYYDITGEAAMNESPIDWIDYQKHELSHSKKIIRDCIEFGTRTIK